MLDNIKNILYTGHSKTNKPHRERKNTMKIKGYVIDVKKSRHGAVEIERDLENLYKVVGCRYIDIVSRVIGKDRFDIVCDDEGLLFDHPIPSALDKNNGVMLVGNLFICEHDGEGNLISLTDEQIRAIRKNVMYRLATTENGESKMLPILCNIDY